MKKRFYAISMIFVMAFALAGCQEPAENGNNGTVPPAPANIQIDLATDELLEPYGAVHEYIHDEDGVDLLIRTDAEVTDFAFIAVDYVEQEEQFSFVAGDPLFSVEELSPDKPFAVKMEVAGVIPNYGVAFTDTDGTEKYYVINFSGRGEEEGPPVFLLDFEEINNN